MKQIFSLIIAISCIFSSTLVSADYFSEEIVGADTEVALLQDIQLNAINLKDNKEIRRYDNTKYLVDGIKTEATRLFEDGSITSYRRYDIITNLDSFVYAMNQYFIYTQRYEQTKKSVYKENLRSYLDDAKGAYDRLKIALKKSTN